jgi:hypothetical protein
MPSGSDTGETYEAVHELAQVDIIYGVQQIWFPSASRLTERSVPHVLIEDIVDLLGCRDQHYSVHGVASAF